jgi:hypothetical protein
LYRKFTSDEGYREYVRALPNTFKNFPTSLDSSKLTTLIEERKITFSEETLESLDVNTDLPVLFVAETLKLISPIPTCSVSTTSCEKGSFKPT